MNAREGKMRTKQAEHEFMFADPSRTHAKNVGKTPTFTKMNILLILGVAACLLRGLVQEYIPTILYSPHFYAGVSLFYLFVFLETNAEEKAWYKQFSPHIKIAAVGLIVLALMKEAPGEIGYAFLYFLLMEVSTGGRALMFSLLFLTAVLPLLFIDGYGFLPYPEVLSCACVLALVIRIFEEHNTSKIFMHMCTYICMVFVVVAALYSIATHISMLNWKFQVLPREWVTSLFAPSSEAGGKIETERIKRQFEARSWNGGAGGLIAWVKTCLRRPN
jgi:hypothetical protein